MKRLIFVFTIAASLALVLTSCAEDTIRFSKKLDGTWEASSFTINNVEQIGLDILFAKITGLDLEFTDEGEGQGTARQILKLEALGIPVSEPISGTYMVVGESGETLRMTLVTDSTTVTFEGPLSIDGKDMTYSYTDPTDSTSVVIKARKQ